MVAILAQPFARYALNDLSGYTPKDCKRLLYFGHAGAPRLFCSTLGGGVKGSFYDQLFDGFGFL